MLTLLTCHIGAVLYLTEHTLPLLTLHIIGIAATYVAWLPKLRCLSLGGDEEGVCELVNTYILVGTWIIPVLRE